MLRGTGSNIYNASLAAALARLGHEVHLLCQDREVEIEGVEIHNPDIGGLLPVYVKDPYEGFEVKAFPELTEEELDRYIDANVAAVREVAERPGGIDAALANHLVMGPAILARAGIGPFAAKIHGSALEYTVKPHPRFLPYAEEGMNAASGVLVGSRHTAESLWAALPDGPGPRGEDPARASRRRHRASSGRVAGRRARGRRRHGRLRRQADRLQGRRPAARRLAAGPRRSTPTRGCRSPGYGEYEDGLRPPARAPSTAATSTTPARSRGSAGAWRGGGEAAADPLAPSSPTRPPATLEAARGMAGSVELIGRLEHDEVAELLPDAEALVMPSTFPEAFGMVAVEAAACGALPVSAGHSGMLEVSRELAAALPPERRRADLVPGRGGRGRGDRGAARTAGWRCRRRSARPAREALVATARRLWSWEGVARGVIAASRGELDRLPLA